MIQICDFYRLNYLPKVILRVLSNPFLFSQKNTMSPQEYILYSSCLENPRDGGAWWASVYGVAQSRTRLEQLSSSSSSSRASLIAQFVKNWPAMKETLVRFLGREDPRPHHEGMGYPLQYSWASLVAQLVKNPPAMWETWVRSLGWEDALEKGMATHSSGLPLWLS